MLGKGNIQVNEILKQSVGKHVLYFTEQPERYIENAISFVTAGAEQGDYVFFVENARILPVIQQQVEQLLTPEQLARVHFMNNYAFYWQNGDFHPPTILAHFTKTLALHLVAEKSFRTWGHIEWGDQEEITRDIEEFEQAIDGIVSKQKAISVCAYDVSRVSEPFKELLLNCHSYLMTDDEIMPVAR
ncbi:MEDS domain-containing protein [Planococcus lenghuensis]|uniref:3-ketoacyl-ACP reductase n=1 Tax=Planococcus lenghuensis TaxID=2213202 RepID=A0A1Q2KVW9_9BACL|nr:MEDS domain-containing protein [Planococcus lenghuensis]AQQ52339.1 3-ketoacyl-ACP reductase [Planococcus lenghuensis]